MGAEAGQDLEKILHRKELERCAGNDTTFCWGIGNSLGKNLRLARDEVQEENLDILFTYMKSKPQKIDRSPPGLLLWLSYWGEQGNLIDLPMHMVVSSRRETQSGKVKKTHYALLCTSEQKIAQMQSNVEFDADRVQNFQKDTPVRAVTAMVDYLGEEVEELGKSNKYKVAFRAKFLGIGFVKLAKPVEIKGNIKKLYEQLDAAKNVQDWENTVSLLKSEARSKIVRPD